MEKMKKMEYAVCGIKQDKSATETPFKIDLPNIKKKACNPSNPNSSTIADRHFHMPSDRISSLVRLIKKSKSNAKILKQSPYCNILHKNSLISFISEKEQQSLHSHQRSPNSHSLTSTKFCFTFVVEFSSRTSSSREKTQKYRINAEECQIEGLISTAKIQEKLCQAVQNFEHKYLVNKLIGFSCVGISKEEGLHSWAKQNKLSPREEAIFNADKPSLIETISYLLSISKLNIAAPELKDVRTYTLHPVYSQISKTPRNEESLLVNPVTISDFKMIKCLGSGGFSTVYLARCLRNNKYYALKLIDKQFIIESEREAIVSNERYILEKIMHPSSTSTAVSRRHQFVTELSVAFETSHHFIFAMEFCPGGELFHQLKKVKKMTQEQAKFYFLEILIALDHIHSHGVVYRDLKPENLLIDQDGHIKIADFGLSKPLNSQKDMSYSFCGSPEYMAPEMLCKSGHNYLLDYYCLGALLYELVVGIPPYYSLNQEEIYDSIMTQELSFPSNIPLSSQIKNLLEGLLNKDMRKRLGSLCGAKEIFFHPWVGKTNRSMIQNKQLKPPFIPNLMDANFDMQDIKSDLESIGKKLNQDGLIGNNFQTHFTEEFYYFNPKQELKSPEPNNHQDAGHQSETRVSYRKARYMKKIGSDKMKSDCIGLQPGQNLNKRQKRRKRNNFKAVSQERRNIGNNRTIQQDEPATSRRFASQQVSLSTRLRRKNNQGTNQSPPKNSYEFKSLGKKAGSHPKFIFHKQQSHRRDQERKKQLMNSSRNGQKQGRRSKVAQKDWLEMMRQNSLVKIGYQGKESVHRQRDRVGRPIKMNHLRN